MWYCACNVLLDCPPNRTHRVGLGFNNSNEYDRDYILKWNETTAGMYFICITSLGTNRVPTPVFSTFY